MLFLAWLSLCTVISVSIVCCVIGILSIWDSIEYQINEEIRTIDEEEKKNG